MKKHFVTFVNYSNSYNTDEDRQRYQLFKQYNSARNREYCKLHGMVYHEVDETVYQIPLLFTLPDRPEFTVKNNNHFARWMYFRKNIDDGTFAPGDLIYHHDADVFVVQLDKEMPCEKDFTYAIDSGNTHCFGAFVLKVGTFANKLIDLMLSKSRFDELTKLKFYKENDETEVFFYWGDQQAYYLACGIKCHSWMPFFYLPNNGFYSQVTPYVAFTLDELLSSVTILPVEWNTTHLIEESGENGGHNTYDIVHSTKNKTIMRHFAGGQLWRFEQYTREYPIT